ncbi:MAG: hypothetical protein AAB877_03370 [Patescibacteria group bacterium]
MKLHRYLLSIFALYFLFFAGFFYSPAGGLAVDYTNSSFILRNPAITVSGGRLTTTSFEFYSATGQTAPGKSTNSAFTYQAGFLYFDAAAAAPATPAAAGQTISGGTASPGAKITFSGKAYPGGTVVLLKDAQIAKAVFADNNADFSIELSGLSSGDYIFSIYGKDYAGKSSRLLLFPVKGVSKKDTSINNILIPPTISKNKKEVKKGGTVDIFGQSLPNAEIDISIEGPNGDLAAKIPSDSQGKYKYILNASDLDYGQYKASSEVSFWDKKSRSSSLTFTVSDRDILEEAQVCPPKADFNNDCAVNLVDFSILIYWFDRPGVPEKIDLDGNGIADLVDFSIMAYHWTG